MATTVAAILANPCYTGRQVWNRQPTDHDAVEPEAGISRTHEIQRRDATAWVISNKPAHPPLVCESDHTTVIASREIPLRLPG